MAAIVSVLLFAGAITARAQIIPPDKITINGDSIDAPLTNERGDAQRGRTIVASRQTGLCLLCHSGPFPEERFQGTIAPSLAGAGSRLAVGQIRLRLVDGTKTNAATLMPSYYHIDGLTRVAQGFRDKTILTAQQIEDVVAYLSQLKD